jgi:hypothetical protein
LGDEEDGEYDFVIDPSTRSVNDVTTFLDEIMQSSDSPQDFE